MSRTSRGIYNRIIKRIIDFVLSLTGLIVLSPLLIVLAILIRIKLGKPVMFKQKRPGLNEKVFTIYKFRTMTDESDENGELLKDGDRLTKFSQFLRSTSLDELPELFNVIKGDMSLVGPRPLLVKYLPLYNERQKRRHTVRPGLTGLAQVSGRNAISWENRFEKDIEYIEQISFINDVKICYRTISLIFSRHGISSARSVTMEEFTGSSEESAS